MLEGSCEVLGASDSTGASTAVDYTPAREEQDGLERRSPTNLTSREIVSHGGRSTGKFTGSLTTPGAPSCRCVPPWEPAEEVGEGVYLCLSAGH